MRSGSSRSGVLRVGEKIQFTDRKGKRITAQLIAGGFTQTEHGLICHDDVIGQSEGVVITTVSAKRESQQNSENQESKDLSKSGNKPWKAARAIGGWDYVVMRPRMVDYVLSMPRGAQIMYPKDIAQVIALGDIRSGMRVLESGAGSGAMSLSLLDAVGECGKLTTIELRPDFARIAESNATLYYGKRPEWWNLLTGDFDSVAKTLDAHSVDRIMLDMLDPWNRLEQAHRVIVPGGVLIAYVTTTTQMSRMAEALRESGMWTEPEIQETLERTWKAQGLAVRPDHAMIGHTGFLIVSRAMAEGFSALKKREHGTKDTVSDIDDMTAEERAEQLEDLSLRDISDRKLRKVLRDLDVQLAQLPEDSQSQNLQDSQSAQQSAHNQAK
ncbi:tRNA (adenine-N1)-methyltransferase [Gardnerella swidsinskii]|uniref:tRNA (adenine-N1)-methyltransferase n=1 Tax=Gardnerella swidsinskii TaxID=2792979 RepID=UPI0039F078AC